MDKPRLNTRISPKHRRMIKEMAFNHFLSMGTMIEILTDAWKKANKKREVSYVSLSKSKVNKRRKR